MAVGKLALPAGSGESARKMTSGTNVTLGTAYGAGQTTPDFLADPMALNTESRYQFFSQTSSTAHQFVKITSNQYGQIWGIKTDGTLWRILLSNTFSSYTTNTTWTQFGTDTNWQDISAGTTHVVAIKGGELWGVGYQPNGQLGIGNTTTYTSWTKVGTDTDWKKVICGVNQTYLTKTNNWLYGAGLATSGMLGNGNTGNQLTPVRIGTHENVIEIAASSNGFLFIKEATAGDGHGAVWGSGTNNFGSLGFTTTGTRTTAAITSITTNATKIACNSVTSWAIVSGNLYRAGFSTGNMHWATTSTSSNSTGFVKDDSNDTNFQDVQLDASRTNSYIGLIKKGGKKYLFSDKLHAYIFNNQTAAAPGASISAIEDWSYFSTNGLTPSNIILGEGHACSNLFISF